MGSTAPFYGLKPEKYASALEGAFHPHHSSFHPTLLPVNPEYQSLQTNPLPVAVYEMSFLPAPILPNYHDFQRTLRKRLSLVEL